MNVNLFLFNTTGQESHYWKKKLGLITCWINTFWTELLHSAVLFSKGLGCYNTLTIFTLEVHGSQPSAAFSHPEKLLDFHFITMTRPVLSCLSRPHPPYPASSVQYLPKRFFWGRNASAESCGLQISVRTMVKDKAGVQQLRETHHSWTWLLLIITVVISSRGGIYWWQSHLSAQLFSRSRRRRKTEWTVWIWDRLGRCQVCGTGCCTVQEDMKVERKW